MSVGSQNFFNGFTQAFSFGSEKLLVGPRLTIAGYLPILGGPISGIVRIAYILTQTSRKERPQGFLTGCVVRWVVEIATGPALAIGHFAKYMFFGPDENVLSEDPEMLNDNIEPEIPNVQNEANVNEVENSELNEILKKINEDPDYLFEIEKNTMTEAQYEEIIIAAFKKDSLLLFAISDNMAGGEKHIKFAKVAILNKVTRLEFVSLDKMKKKDRIEIIDNTIKGDYQRILEIPTDLINPEDYLQLLKDHLGKKIELLREIQSNLSSENYMDLCLHFISQGNKEIFSSIDLEYPEDKDLARLIQHLTLQYNSKNSSYKVTEIETFIKNINLDNKNVGDRSKDELHSFIVKKHKRQFPA